MVTLTTRRGVAVPLDSHKLTPWFTGQCGGAQPAFTCCQGVLLRTLDLFMTIAIAGRHVQRRFSGFQGVEQIGQW